MSSVVPPPAPQVPGVAVAPAGGVASVVVQGALEVALVAAGVALIIAGQATIGLALLSAAVTALGAKVGLPMVAR